MMKDAIITTVETARTLSDLYLLFCTHSDYQTCEPHLHMGRTF